MCNLYINLKAYELLYHVPVDAYVSGEDKFFMHGMTSTQ